MKNFLLWTALVILVFLLFLPAVLRIVGKDLYADAPIKNEMIVKVLRCTNKDETLNIAYQNDVANNYQYLVKGNLQEVTTTTDEKPDINEEIDNEELLPDVDNDTKETVTNELAEKIRKYSTVTYKDTQDITEFRINLRNYATMPEELDHVKSIDEANSYYTNRGFSCTIQSS